MKPTTGGKTPPTSNLLHTLQHLRHYEEMVLYGNLLPFEADEERRLTAWLLAEYLDEAIGYPGDAPEFDEPSALWAAKTVYTAGQLLLHREHRPEDLYSLLPAFEGIQDPGAILSADLFLRFLPDIITQLLEIDPDDLLADILEKILYTWHYSGINHITNLQNLDLQVVLSNKCLYQLYVDRIIRHKNLASASHPSIVPGVRAALGMHAEEHWREFNKRFTQL